RLCRG
ncbi:Isoleucine--tRNA ligase, partial [Haemophilus influenzae]